MNANPGYQATSTLAGTRLNTPVKDVGAAISIYTRDFLDDIEATSAQDVLIYATGMTGFWLSENNANRNPTLDQILRP